MTLSYEVNSSVVRTNPLSQRRALRVAVLAVDPGSLEGFPYPMHNAHRGFVMICLFLGNKHISVTLVGEFSCQPLSEGHQSSQTRGIAVARPRARISSEQECTINNEHHSLIVDSTSKIYIEQTR